MSHNLIRRICNEAGRFHAHPGRQPLPFDLSDSVDPLWPPAQGSSCGTKGVCATEDWYIKRVDTHRVKYWCLVGGRKTLDHIAPWFSPAGTKAFPAARVSIPPSENNGIYLPIRQLGRLKGRREREQPKVGAQRAPRIRITRSSAEYLTSIYIPRLMLTFWPQPAGFRVQINDVCSQPFGLP